MGSMNTADRVLLQCTHCYQSIGFGGGSLFFYFFLYHVFFTLPSAKVRVDFDVCSGNIAWARY